MDSRKSLPKKKNKKRKTKHNNNKNERKFLFTKWKDIILLLFRPIRMLQQAFKINNGHQIELT